MLHGLLINQPYNKASFGQDAGILRADNTQMNEQDKSGAVGTAQKQANRQRYLMLLAVVQRTVADERTLSTAANHAKIIVLNGADILHGSVYNESKKRKVEELAKRVASVTNVTNQLDIKTK